MPPTIIILQKNNVELPAIEFTKPPSSAGIFAIPEIRLLVLCRVFVKKTTYSRVIEPRYTLPNSTDRTIERICDA